MPELSRRGFLAAVIGGLAVACGALFAFAGRGNPDDVVVAILRRRVGFLGFDEALLREFSADYVRSRASYERQLALLSVAALPLTYVTLYRFVPMGHPLRRLEDNVVTRFLMSTDFFLHGADSEREVEYQGFYDPLRTPCRNYIARRADGTRDGDGPA